MFSFAAFMEIDKTREELSKPQCFCRRCIEESDLRGFGGLPLASSMMIVCGECGNKRCPKASDHRLACTNSNEPGQAGSIYE